MIKAVWRYVLAGSSRGNPIDFQGDVSEKHLQGQSRRTRNIGHFQSKRYFLANQRRRLIEHRLVRG